jgi:biotin transport system substrate-specific component
MREPSFAFLPTQQMSSRRLLKIMMAIACGIAVMTLSAKIQLPFWPVPMTLHTLAVMAIAVAFGPSAALSAMTGYLVAGALGLPVFSGSPARGIGITYMMGPTGGYLLGYLIAAGAVGRWSAGKKALGQFGAMLAGLVVVYACGVFWLSFFVPAAQVLPLGITPFLLGDLLKIGVVATGGAALSRFGWTTRLKALAGI